jgi:hypothetical protein
MWQTCDMSRMRALRFAGVLLPLGAWPLMTGAPVSAQVSTVQAPMEITSDTPEYCQKLLTRIGQLVHVTTASVPREVADLTSAGQRMCDRGQTRGGIMRLRSALMLMEKSDEPPHR